jgi:hypothetical protein
MACVPFFEGRARPTLSRLSIKRQLSRAPELGVRPEDNGLGFREGKSMP